MTFKIQTAGPTGSEILHMRPIKPWSHWDTALTVGYFGAAAAMMLTLGADMTNILYSGISDVTTMSEVAKQATGMMLCLYAAKEGRDAYRQFKKNTLSTSADIERLPQISNVMFDAHKAVLHEKMRKHSDMRDIRIVDKDAMEAILGYQSPSLSPMACTSLSFSKKYISVGVNTAFVKSRDHDMQFAIVAHEVSHQYGSTLIQMVSRALQRANSQLVIFAAMQGLFFLNPVTPLLAVTSAFVVPALLQAYYRRQEFRSDRGAAFFTDDARVVSKALNSIEAHSQKSSSRQAPAGTSSAPGTWQDKVSNVMWRVAEKGLGTLMDSHPPMHRRIRALSVLAKQQAYAKQKLG